MDCINNEVGGSAPAHKARSLQVKTWSGTLLEYGFSDLYISAVDDHNKPVGKRLEISVKDGKMTYRELD